MSSQNFIDLVKHFETFTKESNSDDLNYFSVWLQRRLNKDLSVKPAANQKNNESITWLIHRLSKYFRSAAKPYLNANGLKSSDEYAFLISIEKMENPSKNVVYKNTITEITTGAQMLNRLIRIGLVREEQDRSDKRMKRVALTMKGKRVVQRIKEQSKNDMLLKAGNLTEEEISSLLENLIYLEGFHTNLHDNERDSTTEQLINRYLY